MSAPEHPPIRSPKRELREQILASRRHRSLADSVAAAEAIAEHALAWDVVRRSATLAAYVSVNREPGTRVLIEALRAAGQQVLLPVLREDNDLDWALFDGALVATDRGLLEPTGPRLGLDAIADAEVVLVPGLAASSAGERLGYGGGSYDRALARVARGVPVAVLLHEDEVGIGVPTEGHDRRVTHAITPAGVISL